MQRLCSRANGCWTVICLATLSGCAERSVGPAADAPSRVAAAPPTYTLVSLALLPGGKRAGALAINDAGVIGGYSTDSSGAPKPVLWLANGTIVRLPLLPGTDSGMVRGVNAARVAVGVTFGGQLPRSTRWTSPDMVEELLPFTGPYANALAINTAGSVVGNSTSASAFTEPALWRHNGMVRVLGGLTTPPTSFGFANAVNDSNVVVGSSPTSGGPSHAFRWTAVTGMQDLGTIGMYTHEATGVNLAGTIVGFAVVNSAETHVFRWTAAGGMEDLGSVSATYQSLYATGINKGGRIVAMGWNTSDVLRGFYYSGTAWVDLGALNGGASQAFAINRCGVIAGLSFLPTGGSQAVKWVTTGC